MPRTKLSIALAGLAGVAGLSVPAWSQSSHVVVQKGDIVAGGASVLSFENLLVTDTGDWLVQTVTETQTGGQLGFDDIVIGPAGTLPVTASGDWDVDRHGNVVHIARIGPTTILNWNDSPLVALGDAIGAPGLPPATTWSTFYAFRIDDESHVLVFALLTDLSSSFISAAIVRLEIDPLGAILSTNVLLASGDFLPFSPPEAFGFFHRTGFRSFAMANDGQFAWTAITTTGECLLIGLDRVVARTNQGFVAPNHPNLDGRRLASFGRRLDVNDFGSYVYTGALYGNTDSDYVIVKDGQKFVQEGDVLASLGAPLDHRNSAPVYLTNSGDLYWMAELRNTPASENAAYMRNHEVIVRRGRTLLDGQLVTDIRNEKNAFHVSCDGRFWIGEVVLEDVGEALALTDFGLAVPVPGRERNLGTLELGSGDVLVGETVAWRLDNGQAPNLATVLVFSDRPPRPNSSLGILTQFGEILTGPPAFVLIGPTWSGAPVDIPGTIPNDLTLVDSPWFGQGAFIDLTLTSSEPVRLTNGLRLELGAP